MRAVPIYWAYLLLALLVGCTSLEKPETFSEQLAYSEAGLTATYQTIGELKTSGKISAGKRDELVASADAVGAALDASRLALGLGDLSTASAKLRLAQDSLRLLQATLKGLK